MFSNKPMPAVEVYMCFSSNIKLITAYKFIFACQPTKHTFHREWYTVCIHLWPHHRFSRISKGWSDWLWSKVVSYLQLLHDWCLRWQTGLARVDSVGLWLIYNLSGLYVYLYLPFVCPCVGKEDLLGSLVPSSHIMFYNLALNLERIILFRVVQVVIGGLNGLIKCFWNEMGRGGGGCFQLAFYLFIEI